MLGCTDSTAFNYDNSATDDNGSCIAVVEGCINISAFNYSEDANTDDGTCLRDYIHIMDLAEGHIKALDHLIKNDKVL